MTPTPTSHDAHSGGSAPHGPAAPSPAAPSPDAPDLAASAFRRAPARHPRLRAGLLRTSAVLLGGALWVSGCASPAAPQSAGSAVERTAESTGVAESSEDTGTEASAAGPLSPASVLAENADATVFGPDEWDAASALDVDLADPTGAGITARDATVTITDAGVYRFSGTFSGQLVVAAPDDARVVIILDGVTLRNSAGAAIDVQSADDVAIHLADGSTNTVSDAASYAADVDANAAIFSRADLTISGDGALTISDAGNDGITSKDDLVILGGTITISAAQDALRGKDALVVRGGTLDLTAENGDGMFSRGDEGDAAADIDWTRGYIAILGGTIDISAGDDGVQAFTDVIIGGGSLTASVADDGVKAEAVIAIGEMPETDAPRVAVTASTEGIEAASIGISGGDVQVAASDDGINASGNTELQALIADTELDDSQQSEFQDTGEVLEISGGTVTVDAEGDGLDSNGSLTISGGAVTVYGPSQGGNGSLDADGEITVSGGTIQAFGPGDMEQTPSAGEQGWVIVSAPLTAGQSGTIIDETGAELGSFTSAKTASTVLVSTPSITEGGSYSVVSGGEVLGTAVAGTGGFSGPGGMGGAGGPGGAPGEGMAPPAQ